VAAKRMTHDADSIAHQALAAARAEEDRRFDLLAQALRAFEIARDRRLLIEEAAQPKGEPASGKHTITVRQAASIAKRSVDCVRLWCTQYGIGRKNGARWNVNYEDLRRLLKRIGK
jgi:hypothetical protein